MYIVLTSEDSIFLAEWLKRDLEGKLVTDFNKKVMLTGSGKSTADQLIATVGLDTAREENQRAVYFIDVETGKYRKVFKEFKEGEGFTVIFDLAFAPGRQAIAFLSTTPPELWKELGFSGMPGAHKDIFVYDLVKQQAKLLSRGRAFLGLTWAPSGEQLTYGTQDGWIESVNVQSGRTERLFEGRYPAWSPDGNKLAYRFEDTILIYDTKRKVAERIYRNYFFWRHLFGGPYWSPDGRYVSFSMEIGGADLLGLSFISCVVVEVNSGWTFAVNSGGLQCGPWFAAREEKK